MDFPQKSCTMDTLRERLPCSSDILLVNGRTEAGSRISDGITYMAAGGLWCEEALYATW